MKPSKVVLRGLMVNITQKQLEAKYSGIWGEWVSLECKLNDMERD